MAKIISKKKLTVLTVTIMLMFVLVAVAYAALETVHINGRFAVHSDSISSSNGAKCNGSNSKDSEDRLFMTLEYSDGGGWADVDIVAMPIGGGGNLTSAKSGTLLWRVTLNPDELAYCIGEATVENR